MSKIKIGDIVEIVQNDGTTLCNMVVKHIPQGPGDSWHFEQFGNLVIQNPLSFNLDKIIKKEEK